MAARRQLDTRAAPADAMADTAKPPKNHRGAGDPDRKALRERLRNKGQSRAGDGGRPEMTGQSGGGP